MPDETKKTIEVEIYGETFKLKSDQDKEYVREMADRVNELMDKIGRGKLPISNCAVLAAMTLADNLTKKEKEIEDLEKETEEFNSKIDSFTKSIDEKLTEIEESDEAVTSES